MTGIDLAELRSLFLLEALTDEQLQWVADRGEMRTYDAGASVYREGEAADCLFMLVEGRMRLSRMAMGEELVINETGHRGAYSGATRAFVTSDDNRYTNSVVTLAPSRFFRLSAADFAELIRREFPMAVHLLDGLFVGVRNSEATLRQREHLASLGRLSANLAHELNNPAAAAARATGQLRGRVAGMRHKLGGIASGNIDRVAIARLVRLQEEAVELAAKQRRPLTAVEEADREDAFVDRLEQLGVGAAYDLAAVYVAAGLDVDWLDGVCLGVAEAEVEGPLRWLAYTLETETLMNEVEDATGRISSLVASVKQYSYMDGASVQEVDVHVGLDSTVVMLGHKLQGVRVVRAYDRELPKVPAYPAELNQVWTNLIDNAADAMEGSGTLTLRTARDGDALLVEVRDDGPGIPEAVQARMFEAFYTTKPQGSGSGLGLDNAQRIVVRRHRGTIEVQTGPAGTVFLVRLPLVQTLA